MARRIDQATIQDVIRGESKNVEFKEMLPDNSEKYTKTIVAYANTQGGTLIFGVWDTKLLMMLSKRSAMI